MPSSHRPPIAAPRPLTLTIHARTREDPWAWLRDREDPAVRAHLEAENAHTDAVMAPTQPLQEQLYREMLARMREDDETVPVPDGGWSYGTRTIAGRSYAVHVRRSEATADGPEQLVLDENALAEGHPYLAVRALVTSPDHRRVAWAADTRGDERYTLGIRDIASGEVLPDVVENAGAALAWSAAGDHLFYLRQDDARRPCEVWRHALGTPPGDDVRVLHEPDERFHVELQRDRSGRFIVITCESRTSSEVHVVDAATPCNPPRRLIPRREGIELSVALHGERVFILHNDGAPEFELSWAPLDATDPHHWRPLLPHREDTHLERVEAFADHLVVWLRRAGVPQLHVVDLAGDQHHDIGMPEPIYALDPGPNRRFDTAVYRFYYSSMVTPLQVVDYDVRARSWTVRKHYEVPGYDAGALVTERHLATAPDGTAVPISIVRRRCDVGRPQPLMLIGYGAYGRSIDARFSSNRLSLVERGVAVGIAHVRGGGELGRAWYDGGRLLHKPNTFSDFVAATRHVIAIGIACPDRIAVHGGSAGGLLVGAVLNAAPDLYAAAVADVPFVDVLNSMLDATLPLTVIERDEWGDPLLPEHYDAIAAWSPYENVGPHRYPAVLALAGWSDPRVGYWEAAKWVARLRELAVGEPEILLRTHMGAGHGGPSGRYAALAETAFVFAFVLRQLGAA
ncbi:MAG: S9 family peptidase [Nannocystaceae bacterium]|nr:S9 family peptidase [Deltaproteobacteria bacterium]MBP7287584.1 S9 family peptidase [Nannocystaceae bacterium]